VRACTCNSRDFPGLLDRDVSGGLVAHVSIHYLREIHYPDTLVGAVALGRIGRTSYCLAQALFQNATCVGAADTTIAWREQGKAAPLPPDLVRRLSSYKLREPDATPAAG
jgi:acyl-CoA thioesterase FadM